MPSLDLSQIKEYLPHRYPFLLVDRVEDYVKGEWIRARKNVSANEEYFTGHFPHKPVMPGVLMIEALAQSAAILSFLTMDVKPDDKSVVYFVGVDNARFKRPVEPGDQLILNVKITRNMRGIWKYSGYGTVDGNTALEAELMCTMRSV